MANVLDSETRIKFHDLELLLAKIFIRFGVSEANGKILATNCASCERDGSLSHGVFRIPGYVASLKSGWVDGNAVPDIEEVGPAFLRVNARNGFAQPALAAVLPRVINMVSAHGVAVVTIK